MKENTDYIFLRGYNANVLPAHIM